MLPGFTSSRNSNYMLEEVNPVALSIVYLEQNLFLLARSTWWPRDVSGIKIRASTITHPYTHTVQIPARLHSAFWPCVPF